MGAPMLPDSLRDLTPEEEFEAREWARHQGVPLEEAVERIWDRRKWAELFSAFLQPVAVRPEPSPSAPAPFRAALPKAASLACLTDFQASGPPPPRRPNSRRAQACFQAELMGTAPDPPPLCRQ